ncbi:hypothetical protein, partial [Cupriavidus campinensis]
MSAKPTRTARITRWLTGARDRLARHLGVTAPAHGGIWLLRAVFQPPRPGKPDLPAEWAALLYRRALARLGMGR